MNSKSYRLLLLVCAIFSASSAFGQSSDWYISGSAVFFDDDPDRAVGDAFGGVEARVGYDITNHLTVEGMLSYATLDGFTAPGESFPDQDHIDFGANLLIRPGVDSKFSPYLLVGLGYLNVSLNPGGTDSSNLTSFGMGFDWRIGEGDWSIRSELRARTALDSTSHRFGDERDLVDMLFTIGVKNNFGAPSSRTGSGTGGLPDDWYAAGSVVYFDDDPDRALDAGFGGAQFHVGRDLNEYLSLEGTFGYYSLSGFTDPAESYSDQRHVDVGANLLYYPWREWTVSPYVLLGLGYLTADLNPGTSDSGISGSFGLGMNWKIGNGDWSVRAEARGRTIQDSIANRFGDERNLTDYLVSVGVQYNFGASARRPVLPEGERDTDRDGVLDIWDECPDTPFGNAVSANGCPLLEREGDDDGDRIPNSRDECPNTPAGAAVNPRGCSLDSDGDGVPTDQDRCPSSRPGADVDVYGCENDRDGDGVLDHRDRCPDSRPGVRVDIYGCEIGDIIQLPELNFETGSEILLPGTEHILQDAAATLQRYPELVIEVAGHTDDVGNGLANYTLSERRAQTVREYLIRYGVDENRINAVGYGESQPIGDNSTPEGRAENRRVELRILERQE